ILRKHLKPYLFKKDIASDRRELARLGFTRGILNCSQSKWRSGGIEAHKSPSFDMNVNFYPAAEFTHRALSSKVLVHCAVSVSHSAALVLAIKTVKDPCGIIPKRGFFSQLNCLDGILALHSPTSPTSP
uniref:Protein-serine/threonine phosphatase n=1 Tax=Oncorhynchus tshawytscha TaxID=74940 RepID=A0A8C8C6R3_ONCTS